MKREWRLQTWISDALRFAQTEEERRLYEYNARAQVTLWGNEEQSLLFDYAWKEWAGLVGTYYYGRWKLFLDMLSGTFRTGVPYDDERLPIFENRIIWRASPFYSDMANWEARFINSTEPIPLEVPDSSYLDEMIGEYVPKVMALDTSVKPLQNTGR